MNSKNSETSDSHRLLLNLIDKINLKRSDKYVALSNHSICYTNTKKTYKNNKFKISALTRKEEFVLPVLFVLSDIQDYFEYILKKT